MPVPVPKRERVEPTEDWQQLRLLVASAAQEAYELLRPIVLFGVPPAERARQTGLAERTVRRQVDRFDAQGMASLFVSDERGQADHRTLPSHLRQAILALGAEYPAFRAQCYGSCREVQSSVR